jgi:hypothetical protein
MSIDDTDRHQYFTCLMELHAKLIFFYTYCNFMILTFFKVSSQEYTVVGKGNHARTETPFSAGSPVSSAPLSRSFHTSATSRLSACNWKSKNSAANYKASGTILMHPIGMDFVRYQSSATDSVTSVPKSDGGEASKQTKKAHKAEVSVIYCIGQEFCQMHDESGCSWPIGCNLNNRRSLFASG